MGCSPAPMPVATSSNDPSNPRAAEGVPSLRAAAATPGAAAHDHGHEEGSAMSSDAGTASYVCPMHPEVTSSEPGSCPKCHMKLIPKK